MQPQPQSQAQPMEPDLQMTRPSASTGSTQETQPNPHGGNPSDVGTPLSPQ
jgi:hypothetical protein